MSNIRPTLNVISTLNSRAASTLLPNAIFTGVSEEVLIYGRAGISISSDNPSDGKLYIEVSHDNVNWGCTVRDFRNPQIAEPHMWYIL